MPTFDFALDGKTDLMSLHPLEVTNFEMGAGIIAVAGVLLAFILTRLQARRQKPHVFTASETDEDAIV